MKIHEKYIQSYTHNGHIGVLVEFGLESSMLPRTEEFKELSKNIAMHIAAEKPEDVEDLLSQDFVKEPAVSINELIQKFCEELKERVSVVRFVRWDTDFESPQKLDPPPKDPAVAMGLVK